MPALTKINSVSPFLQGLATLVLVVFTLYAARTVIIPVALAVLGSFILSPIVAVLERAGLGRVAAALATLLATGSAVAGVGWVITDQATELMRELPTHEREIKTKIDLLSPADGPMAATWKMFQDLTKPTPQASPHSTVPSDTGSIPVPPETREVIVERVDGTSRLARLASSAFVLVEPLAHAALVAALLAFMLIGREDLRDRLFGVIGEGRVLGTTRVVGDAARKVSRFLLFQLIVNTGFGICLTIGLLIIGVPYAPLWGFLSGMLRFIPYVGTWISALFPFALSFATSQGWSQPIAVFVYFLVLDLVTANAIEPLLFGHHTGVSPLALLVSVAFWTWIWGPIGLLLSTPITVCLAVIGRHVPGLQPLAVLLGDHSALSPATRYYQRLLAGDPNGAGQVVADAAAATSPAQVYDEILLPALLKASSDRATADLTEKEDAMVFEGMTEAIARLSAGQPLSPLPAQVLGVPARRIAEGLPLRMLAEVLATEGIGLTEVSIEKVADLVAEHKTHVVVVSVVPPGSLQQATDLCHRLRERYPDLSIIVAYWGMPDHHERLVVRLKKCGASFVTTSLRQACDQVREVVGRKK